MAKKNIKKGDVVVVIAGADKGKSGKVLKVYPKAGKLTIEGVNVHKKCFRRSQAHPNGGIESLEFPIDRSNAMLEEVYQARKSKKQGAEKA